MAKLLDLPKTHLTPEQQAFKVASESHDAEMDRSSLLEDQQYQSILRQLQLFGSDLKPALDDADAEEPNQRTDFSTRVGVKSGALWAANKSKTKAILIGIADSMGLTYAQLMADLDAVSAPNEFEAARTVIANA